MHRGASARRERQTSFQIVTWTKQTWTKHHNTGPGHGQEGPRQLHPHALHQAQDQQPGQEVHNFKHIFSSYFFNRRDMSFLVGEPAGLA